MELHLGSGPLSDPSTIAGSSDMMPTGPASPAADSVLLTLLLAITVEIFWPTFVSERECNVRCQISIIGTIQ